MGGLTHLLLHDVDACRAVTDELYPLAERNKFPWPLTYARFQKGWLRALAGERELGIQEMVQSAIGAPVAVLNPVVWTLIAEQQIEAGDLSAALASLETAFRHSGQSGFYEAEVVRLRGELLLRQTPARVEEAEAAFRQAIALTAKQSCRALELRSATSLGRVLHQIGRMDEARDVLAPVYGAFSEGLDRPDLKAAETVLSALS
jgi:predicted ATPase